MLRDDGGLLELEQSRHCRLSRLLASSYQKHRAQSSKRSGVDVIWSLFAHRLFARLAFARRGAVRVGGHGWGLPPKFAAASAAVVLRKFFED
jgi:hypothetical protein